MVQSGWEKGRPCCCNDELIEIWYYKTQEVAYNVNTRYFYSDWGEAEQVTIQKILTEEKANELFNREPTMHEKNAILNDLNIRVYGSVSFEIFPTRDKIVDEQDLFHVWIVERKKALPFCTECFETSIFYSKMSVKINGTVYHYRVSTVHNFKSNQKQCVYYIWKRSGKELSWREKQDFKDTVIGEKTTAIETIKERDGNASALIVLPPQVTIPFGLKPTKSTKIF